MPIEDGKVGVADMQRPCTCVMRSLGLVSHLRYLTVGCPGASAKQIGCRVEHSIGSCEVPGALPSGSNGKCMGHIQAVNEEGVGEAALPIKILGPGSAPEKIRPTVVENGFKLSWQVKGS